MRRLLLKLPLVSALVTLPAIFILLTQGVLSLSSEGLFFVSLAVGISSALIVCILAVSWLYWRRRKDTVSGQESIDMVSANPAWGAQQLEAWTTACQHIDTLLGYSDDIGELPDHTLAVLRDVAATWSGSGKHLEYAITLPEGLLAAETLAARYRRVLMLNIPLSNTVKMSQVLFLWDAYEKHEKKIQYSRWAYRVYRAFSIPGLISELSSTVLGELGESAKENLIYNLKRAYLQEVANVSIDLYSGNFRRAIDELPVEKDTQRDLDNLASQVGPIRIVIIGQISSGKSSLVNSILSEFRAESGLVPTTEDESTYKFTMPEGFDTHIIDTPGVEPGKTAIQHSLKRLVKADLVIWVMRANQPGRSVDQELFKAFDKFFTANSSRQRPAVLVAATHIDRIIEFNGVSENNLVEAAGPLAKACNRVVEYDEFCPLALCDAELGVTSLLATLGALYERAVNARLNRLRLERPSLSENASAELERLKIGTIEAVKRLSSKRVVSEVGEL